MEEAQQKLLDISNQEIFEDENPNTESSGSTQHSYFAKHKWWYQVAIFTSFTLIGEVVTSLLVNTYFTKGGKSIWLASFVQNAGFPILLPFLCYASLKNKGHIEVRNLKRKRYLRIKISQKKHPILYNINGGSKWLFIQLLFYVAKQLVHS
ncbi:purine permease 21-like isoform X2 [Lycium barbarum]|uniref:purine permease 21-like isoform X2 n=1 Tax=Lycium barbarum TaxID=112863 RepID=UPI00293ECF2F|nr:purine permease 21-like isoform X2 [Lycium barbarum]